MSDPAPRQGASVLAFPKKVEQDSADPTFEGRVKCLACQHTWQAVAPYGTIWLECPSCTLVRGTWLFPFSRPEGCLLWTCKCGNQLLLVTETKVLCPHCGTFGDPHPWVNAPPPVKSPS